MPSRRDVAGVEQEDDLATLLVTGELVRRKPALYDPQVSDGKILVGVDGSSRADDVERALSGAGGSVKRV